jgi:flagellar biosynthetic protein FlhB
MARKRMMAEVPKADVVITNPTHYAVALRYERGGMAAPQVIAKGADHVALHIRELARKHRVPVVENKPVARALYRVELGQPVPEDMFKAVAEILAYVYSLKRK